MAQRELCERNEALGQGLLAAGCMGLDENGINGLIEERVAY